MLLKLILIGLNPRTKLEQLEPEMPRIVEFLETHYKEKHLAIEPWKEHMKNLVASGSRTGVRHQIGMCYCFVLHFFVKCFEDIFTLEAQIFLSCINKKISSFMRVLFLYFKYLRSKKQTSPHLSSLSSLSFMIIHINLGLPVHGQNTKTNARNQRKHAVQRANLAEYEFIPRVTR